MPYAVTLPLDDDAAGHVKRLWCALAEQAGDDDAIRLGYVPHITLTILPDTAAVDEAADAALRVAGEWAASSIVIAGLGIFPGEPPVLWAGPTVTATLLDRHAELHGALARFKVHPHYEPGSWVPHVTLSKSGSAPLALAIASVCSAWRGPIRARLKRIEIVRFRPVEVLRSQALPVPRDAT